MNPLLEPSPDHIVEGIHRIRDELLAQHGGNLQSYVEAAIQRQRESQSVVAQTASPSQPKAGVAARDA